MEEWREPSWQNLKFNISWRSGKEFLKAPCQIWGIIRYTLWLIGWYSGHTCITRITSISIVNNLFMADFEWRALLSQSEFQASLWLGHWFSHILHCHIQIWSATQTGIAHQDSWITVMDTWWFMFTKFGQSGSLTDASHWPKEKGAWFYWPIFCPNSCFCPNTERAYLVRAEICYLQALHCAIDQQGAKWPCHAKVQVGNSMSL